MAEASPFSTGLVMARRIVVVIGLAFLATACQKKASGQSVAVVNNEEITSSDLNAELASENATSANSPQARQIALQNLINRRLLAQQAHSDGLDKSPDFLNQQRRANEDLLIKMLITRQVNTSQVPTAEEISQFEAGHPGMFAKRETWTLQQLVFPLSKDATLAAKLKTADTLQAVSQALSAAGVQFTTGTRKIDTAVLPPSIYTQLSTLKTGEPFIVPGSDQEVASVITARESNPLSPDQARAAALNAIRAQQIQKVVDDRVKSLKAKAKISYQPGFAPPKS
ncbi:MAG: EpsD family peptidyl-prolyl cis-trans isomerase [Sphingomicrobium sp.]